MGDSAATRSPSTEARGRVSSVADAAAAVWALIDNGVTAAQAGSALCDLVDESVEHLVAWEFDAVERATTAPQWTAVRPRMVLAQRLVSRCAELWATGWQPVDVAHVVRHHSKPKLVRLVVLVMAAEPAAANVDMPGWWADQLAALDVAIPGRIAGPAPIPQLLVDSTAPVTRALLDEWQWVERGTAVDVLNDAVTLLGALTAMRPIAELAPPPSRWSALTATPNGSHSQPRRSGEASAVSDKTLATIRALLAKAEATTFEAEAESFAAKAQEMMARYAIDAAMLEANRGQRLADGVRSRRVHLDHPYAKEKLSLLATVAEVNRVRTIYDERYSFATLVGFAEDITVTDLLFTSLLVQATRSLGTATAALRRGSSPSFRRGFWIAYAVRIGERLREAERQAEAEATVHYGSSLVPLLEARNEAVSERVDELFTNLQPMKQRRIDSEGWYAGRTAADLASIGSVHAPIATARN
jgi:Protein of unknown function (DUF2786)